MSRALAQLPATVIDEAVRRALAEDLGRGGDLTSEALIAADQRAAGWLVTRADGVACGLALAAATFAAVDPEVRFEPAATDGDELPAAARLARVEGRARSLLAAERTALNFLGHLSGIATATRRLVRLVGDRPARVVCTRKTTPGLRALEKYAVRAGGGANHRFALDDGVLIKDNHLALVGDAGEAVRRARRAVGHMVRVEVEVDDLEQLDAVLAAGADAVLLDNMPPQRLAEAVRRCRGRALTEASGGVNLDNLAAVAASGVDLVSVGWITHSAPSLDVAFDLDPAG